MPADNASRSESSASLPHAAAAVPSLGKHWLSPTRAWVLLQFHQLQSLWAHHIFPKDKTGFKIIWHSLQGHS